MKKRLMDLDTATTAIKPFLKQYLQEHGIDTSKNFSCLNPKHEDKDPSMTLKKDPEHAFCFGCQQVVDIFTAAHFLEDKPIKGTGWIEDNLLYLAEKYGIVVEMADLTQDEVYEYRTYKAYQLAADLVADEKFGDYSKVDKETKARGWDKKRLIEWGIGTVNFQNFRETLKQAGFEPGFLGGIDLDRSNLFNEDSLIFTVFDEFGRPVGFSARNLKYGTDGNNAPKYNNTRVTGLECNIFKKGKRLYGFEMAKDASSPLYLFEGQTDVITARHHGYMNCACTLGTSFTDHHISLLKRHGIFNLTLVFDSDNAGETAIQKMLDEKLAPHKEFRIKLIHLPSGMDPDQLFREKGAEEFVRLKRWDAFEWRLQQFLDDEDPEVITNKIIPIILSDKNHVRHERMTRVLATRTGISFSSIMSEVKRQRSEKESMLAERKKAILEDALYRGIQNPEEAHLVLTEASALVNDVQKKFGEDHMASSSVLDFVLSQKETDENKSGEFAGFYLNPEGLGGIGARLDDNWRRDHWICIGGVSQAGKCQSYQTLIPLPSGNILTIKEIVKRQEPYILGMNSNKKIVPMKVSNWIDSGELECFEVKTKYGISTKPSETHPYYTLEGWKEVKDLKIGERIAVVRNYDCFDNLHSPISEDEAITLAGFLAEENTIKTTEFSDTDNEIIKRLKTSCTNIWTGTTFKDTNNKTILDWFQRYNLFDKDSHNKLIPDDVFKCSLKRISKFLGMFWACNGWVYFNPKKGDEFEIGLTLYSYKMLKQIRSLLLRFGINTKIASSKKRNQDGKELDTYTISIKDIENAKKFYDNIRILLKYKQEDLKSILDSGKNNIEKCSIDLADGDIYFDEITSIKPIGKHQCYDLEIPEGHNFIAEDTVVHNTTMVAQLAYEIASDNRNNATVIYHSIDDAARFILFKMVANAADDIRLQLGHITNPNYWSQQGGYEFIPKLREKGYRKIIQLVKDHKLIIKDASENNSLAYAENMLRYQRETQPDKNIVLIIDNFHKIPDYANKHGHERIKMISNQVKSLAITYGATLITTVEYRKIYDNSLPTNSDIADSRAIEYDSTCVLHMHNDVHQKGEDNAILVHEHEGRLLPRVRVGFGKNKISGYEGREFLDFFPASAVLKAVDLETAERDQKARTGFLLEEKKKDRHLS